MFDLVCAFTRSDARNRQQSERDLTNYIDKAYSGLFVTAQVKPNISSVRLKSANLGNADLEAIFTFAKDFDFALCMLQHEDWPNEQVKCKAVIALWLIKIYGLCVPPARRCDIHHQLHQISTSWSREHQNKDDDTVMSAAFWLAKDIMQLLESKHLESAKKMDDKWAKHIGHVL